MSYRLDDTICALASAPGGAARGIVRAAGPDAVGCLETWFVPDNPTHELTAVRQARVVAGRLFLPGFDSQLPCDVYVWPGSRSYTRQPTVEIHTFGSPPLLEVVFATLAAAGARPARPGEFTLRAFLAGRLDLTQAEAVLGVIDATSEVQLTRALGQLAGGLARPLDLLRSQLLDVLAQLEAGLDFAEEGIEFVSAADLDRQLTSAESQIDQLSSQMVGRHAASELARVVLVGSPNVGKSSLFNALAGREAAIVSPTPGTTRDYLTARLNLAGIGCELVDTAGVDAVIDVEAGPSVESAAQAAAAAEQRGADVELVCVDASQPLAEREKQRLAQEPAQPRLIAWTKADLAPAPGGMYFGLATTMVGASSVLVSSRTGTGLEQLRQRLRELIVEAQAADCQVVASTAARCRDSLHLASECLAQARRMVAEGGREELVASDLRAALAALGEVVGAVYTDDVLDRIFSRFCIGK